MAESREEYIKRVMSCEARGAGASLLRGALAIAEPFYASVTMLRNAMFDLNLRGAHKLDRPIISIGNSVCRNRPLPYSANS